MSICSGGHAPEKGRGKSESCSFKAALVSRGEGGNPLIMLYESVGIFPALDFLAD